MVRFNPIHYFRSILLYLILDFHLLSTIPMKNKSMSVIFCHLGLGKSHSSQQVHHSGFVSWSAQVQSNMQSVWT